MRGQVHARMIPEVSVHKHNPQWIKSGHYWNEYVSACKQPMLSKYIKNKPTTTLRLLRAEISG